MPRVAVIHLEIGLMERQIFIRHEIHATACCLMMATRFIAVTRPISYARHRNAFRVRTTLTMTWVISIAISSPIVLGANYTAKRAETPSLCTFYNADFIIYSSMGSFYLPCVAMLLLYWKIFRVINERVRRTSTTTVDKSAALRGRRQRDAAAGEYGRGVPRTFAVGRDGAYCAASSPRRSTYRETTTTFDRSVAINSRRWSSNCRRRRHYSQILFTFFSWFRFVLSSTKK
jgi:hypothetical protein